jgi:hypothetical protein
MPRDLRWATLVSVLASVACTGCFSLDRDGDGFIDVPAPGGYERDELACSNGRDDDQDGRIDCQDTDCLMGGHCGEQIPLLPPYGIENTFELCTNGIDDDEDGQFDCGDRGCQDIFELCCLTEVDDITCSDRIDNDGNGFADCSDFSCRNNPYVTVCDVESDCADRIDNDGDRFTDCNDSDCDLAAACLAGGETNCTNGVDDDADGDTDCLDRSCYTDPACLGPEVTAIFCQDGNDNDGNGFVDCDDFACSMNPDSTIAALCMGGGAENTLELCSNGIDDDGNRYTDCGDRQCYNGLVSPPTGAAVSYCEARVENTVERCSDGTDNDGNGFTDCNDFSCSRSTNPTVLEFCRAVGEANFENCSDGIDNDRNGFVDCGDFSCLFIQVSFTGLCSTTSDCPAGQSCYRNGAGARICLSLRSPCFESLFIDDDSDVQGNEDGTLPTDATVDERRAMAWATCTDGVDNDGDGFTDCEDWECNHNPFAVQYDPTTDTVIRDGAGNSVPLCRFAGGRTCISGPRAGQPCAGGDTDCGGVPGTCVAGPAGADFVCP